LNPSRLQEYSYSICTITCALFIVFLFSLCCYRL